MTEENKNVPIVRALQRDKSRAFHVGMNFVRSSMMFLDNYSKGGRVPDFCLSLFHVLCTWLSHAGKSRLTSW